MTEMTVLTIMTDREWFLLLIGSVIYIALFILTVQNSRRKVIDLQERLNKVRAMQELQQTQSQEGIEQNRKKIGELESLIRKSNDSIVFLETSIGPTIGCHVGPGMMSCCFWGADRRETASISDRIARSVRRS